MNFCLRGLSLSLRVQVSLWSKCLSSFFYIHVIITIVIKREHYGQDLTTVVRWVYMCPVLNDFRFRCRRKKKPCIAYHWYVSIYQCCLLCQCVCIHHKFISHIIAAIYDMSSKIDFNTQYRIIELNATPLCLDFWWVLNIWLSIECR